MPERRLAIAIAGTEQSGNEKNNAAAKLAARRTCCRMIHLTAAAELERGSFSIPRAGCKPAGGELSFIAITSSRMLARAFEVTQPAIGVMSLKPRFRLVEVFVGRDIAAVE
jgi:hypothetical protein